MFEFLINKLKAHPRKIVFTEGPGPGSGRSAFDPLYGSDDCSLP